jgi:hypothetical protein
MHNAFVNDKSDKNDYRTIDYERSAVLSLVKFGNPEAIYGFFLDWHGQRIYFEGREIGMNRFRDENGDSKLDLEWVINGIYIPKEFPENHEVVFQVICEALDAYGTYFNRDRVNSVKVTHTENAYDFEMPDLNHRFWWDELENA